MPTPSNNAVASSVNGTLVATVLTLNPNDNEGRLVLSGTYTGVTGTIDVSADGTTYYNIEAIQESNSAPVNGTLSPSAANLSYWFRCSGWNYARFNPTAVSTGTLIATVYAASSLGGVPIGVTSSSQTSFTSGTFSGTLGVTGAVTLASTLSTAGIHTVTGGSLYPDNATATFGTGNDIVIKWDATDLVVTQAAPDSIVKWGVSGAGINHVFYGDTATYDMTWDQTNNQLLFNDNAILAIGTGAGGVGDIAFTWNASQLNVTQLTTNSGIFWGVDGAGIDHTFYGDTASAKALWDQSADTLIFSGVAGVQGAVVKQAGVVAITTTRAVTRADSGGVFTVDQGTAYTITVAQPSAAGERYLFQLVGPAAHDVSLVATGCTFEGIIQIDGVCVPATGSTLKFASGSAILGDNIELIATSTTKFLVRAFGSGAGGITIT